MNRLNEMQLNIGVLGCGHLGSALISGLLTAGYESELLHILERDAEVREGYQKQGITCYAEQDLKLFVGKVDILFIAVRPGQQRPVIESFELFEQQGMSLPLAVSCLAGVPLVEMTKTLKQTWVRMMPNLPIAYGVGVMGVYAPDLPTEQVEMLDGLLGALGQVFWLKDEDSMHILTAVSGSGPALIWRHLQAMIDAAIDRGLDPLQARLLVLQTSMGATRMGLEQQGELGSWCQQVASKGGTTEQVLAVLDKCQFSAIVMESVFAAARRSLEITEEEQS